MSQLSLYNILLQTLNAFTYGYVLTSHISDALLFYPIGIALSLYILAAIAYMVLKAAEMLSEHLNKLNYLFRDISDILEQISHLTKYFSTFMFFIYSAMGDAMKVYSVYFFIFYVKRIEFYIFWLLVVLAYC